MVRKLLLTAIIALPFSLLSIIATAQTSTPESAGDGAKMTKDDIIILMVQVGRVPVVQQDRKMETIWENMDGSQTPRSDFLFCTGFAYLGNYKAQACLGHAYEKGRGADRDFADAYVWYSIALENPIKDPADKLRIQADRDRMRKVLLSGTPARTEKELNDLIKTQKAFRAECLAEVRDTKF
jgi:hypothetical protein